tara:strand:+ start:519 stop:749 length:231 start_codon:yes stop_codon:yes gene_type:complete
MSYLKELSVKIARSRESIKDWEDIKAEDPLQDGYCDLQIAREQERIDSWQIEQDEHADYLADAFYECELHGDPRWD